MQVRVHDPKFILQNFDKIYQVVIVLQLLISHQERKKGRENRYVFRKNSPIIRTILISFGVMKLHHSVATEIY